MLSNKNIKIVTRTYGGELHEQCKKFINLPYEIIPFKGTGNGEYVENILKIDADFIINIDEDCFIYDNQEIINLLQYMVDNNYDYCGVSDGGILIMRAGSPIVMNPFFNIFDLRKIRPKFLEAKIDIKISNYKDPILLEKIKLPLTSLSFNPTTKEDYYPLFYWLARNFNPLYLNGFNHNDKWATPNGTVYTDKYTSVVLSHNNKKICYHTWLARWYDVNRPDPYLRQFQRLRINRLIDCLKKELDIK